MVIRDFPEAGFQFTAVNGVKHLELISKLVHVRLYTFMASLFLLLMSCMLLKSWKYVEGLLLCVDLKFPSH